MDKINAILHGDCLELMKDIPNGSIDMILCDLPYGTTACKWDVIIPFDKLWEQYERIIKPNGAIVLTASQPFTSALVMSNPKMFKYCWVWDKKVPSGMTYARFQPMRQHEDVLIFSKNKCIYNPQIIKRDVPIKSGGQKNLNSESTTLDKYKIEGFKKTYDTKNPTTIIQFNKVRTKSVHPTQKPLALFKYLIKTYTNEGELVLDNTAGSCTTAIAALETCRNYICMEKDEKYYSIGLQRVKEWHEKQGLFNTKILVDE
jgi:site-specific DNA-methyltransferase (adenine-specific)